MRKNIAPVIAMIVVGCSQATGAHSQGRLVIDQVHPRRAATIAVISGALGANGAIDPAVSAYGANRSMPLKWSAVAGAVVWAVVIEDPDAPSAKPFLHWLVWNIPGPVTALIEGLPTYPRLSAPPGADQGRNDAGATGYHGPHPPAGPAHRYHIEVFALDQPLAAAPGADLATVLAAMRGHVIADGQVVGTFAAPHS